jgi:hypothetical protein
MKMKLRCPQCSVETSACPHFKLQHTKLHVSILVVIHGSLCVISRLKCMKTLNYMQSFVISDAPFCLSALGLPVKLWIMGPESVSCMESVHVVSRPMSLFKREICLCLHTVVCGNQHPKVSSCYVPCSQKCSFSKPCLTPNRE